MPTSFVTTKSHQRLTPVIAATRKLWRQHHLAYDQACYVAKEVRRALALARPKAGERVVARLSRAEERVLIQHAYHLGGTRGLPIKTLFQTGARVSESAHLRVKDLSFEEQQMLIAKGKRGKSRCVPMLPSSAHELRTCLGNRAAGSPFETTRHTCYSSRRLQQIIKETAAEVGITKRVYPHLLRHSVTTRLLEGGRPLGQIQKFLGHTKLEKTQVYAESSTEMMKAS
jgi:integrase/recombinase XerD